jgi:hypothetical protein
VFSQPNIQSGAFPNKSSTLVGETSPGSDQDSRRQMYLHVPTILFLTVLVALLTGVLLIFSWAQNRSHRSFAWWGWANLLLANALLFLGYGAMACAARQFVGWRTDFRLLFGGAALWLIFCQFPALHLYHGRICFVSAGIADYSWGVGYILVKGRTERLASLVPAAAWRVCTAFCA